MYIIVHPALTVSNSKRYKKGKKAVTLITSYLFLDFLKWRKCQALLKFKKQEREYIQAQGEESYSSDEVF